MLNKREKDMLLTLIAESEWNSNITTTSGCAQVNNFVANIKTLFNISDDDLEFHRAWEIWKLTRLDDTDLEYFDALHDYMGTISYDEFCDYADADRDLLKLRSFIMDNRTVD